MTDLRNWAGNLRYSTENLHAPDTLEEVQERVAACHKLRVLGSRHSFNSIADSKENLLSLSQERFQQIGTVDPGRRTVTVGGGVRYGELCSELHRQGYALHNLASLPHISVAGACATATHGSGDNNGNLATAVSGLQLVLADGSVKRLSRHQTETEKNEKENEKKNNQESQDENPNKKEEENEFAGFVVGLGALGVVTELTLDVVPAFWVRQDLFENVSLNELDRHFDALFSSAYSVSLFTDWREAVFTQAWRKSLVTDDIDFDIDFSRDLDPDPHGVLAVAGQPDTWFGATPATQPLHPIPENSPDTCTAQGVPGPWHRRLPHFRLEFTPSNGSELQSEYQVPRQHILPALHAIATLRSRIAPLLLTSEIRTIAADDLWMSPSYRQPCVAIHFTWQQDWPGVSQLLPDIEAALAPFHARPHWGKLFLMSREQLAPLYPRLPDFQRLLATHDPQGKFRNDFVNALI